MKRILVLYASHYGQTRLIAQRIAEHLEAHDFEVELADAGAGKPPPPVGYDAIVLGSRVEIGHHASVIVDYLRRHADALQRIPTCFFSVSMAASRGGTDPNGYITALFDDLHWKPTCSAAFAGGLPYRKYNWITRAVMKRISRAAGHTTDTSKNHEFTSWAAVRAFAEDVYASLRGPAAAQNA